MTNQELSDEFDILFNSITSNQAPGLDQYEKSVFLTKAQDEIVKTYFSAKSNKTGDGFDDNEIRQIDFSMLVKSVKKDSGDMKDALFDNKPNSKSVEMPVDLMMVINEFVDVTRNGGTTRLTVVPIDYMEYSRVMTKPYKRPLYYQAWRLLCSNGEGADRKNCADLIVGPNDGLSLYNIRYVRRPQSIILTDLEGVTLDGKTKAQECELDPILHQEVLQRAVELAKAAYMGGLDSQLALGGSSQTNIGYVPQAKG